MSNPVEEVASHFPVRTLTVGQWQRTLGSVLIPRLPRRANYHWWRGNRCLSESFTTDSRLLFSREGLLHEEVLVSGCGGVLLLTAPHDDFTPHISAEAAASVWADGCRLLVDPAEFMGTIVTRQVFSDGVASLKFLQALFHCGTRVMHFNAELLSIAMQATRADGVLGQAKGTLPHILLTRHGKPCCLAIGYTDATGGGPELQRLPAGAGPVPLWFALRRPERTVQR